MSREVQAVTLLIIGVVLSHLVFTDAYLEFVKGSMWLPLVATAAVLIVLGLLSLVRDKEDELAADEADAAHDTGELIDLRDLAVRTPADGERTWGAGLVELQVDTRSAGSRLDARLATGGTPTTTDHGVGRGSDTGDHHDGHDHDGHDHEDHGGHGGHGGHGHDHARAPRIGMLVLVPILALLLVAPEALGAHAAGRGGANRVAAPVLQLPPLPEAVDGAVPMTLGDTVVRALYETDGPLAGTPVRLVGFVAHDDDVPGYRLSRFSVSCCAADASVRQVLMEGSPLLEEDTWVEVIAIFEGTIYDPDGDGGAIGVPVMRLLDEQVIERPTSPYEY